jgi:beta-glucosidase
VDPHAVPLSGESEPAPEPDRAAVRVGAALPLAVSLGHAATSDLGPTAGNGFETAWADDLAALTEAGVRVVRLPVDWSRLQPSRGTLDGGWVEWYRQVLGAARRLGVECWASLWEHGVPRWFADDGGFGDDVATARSWPRWVDAAAEALGDLVDGWFPMTEPQAYADETRPDDARRHREMLDHLRLAWRDAWRILAGGPPVASTSIDQVVPAASGECDIAGLTIRATAADRHPDRLLDELQRAADELDTRPIAIAALVVRDDDPDVQSEVLAAARAAIAAAIDDGIDIRAAFASPAIAARGRRRGLLDDARHALPSAVAWLAR